MAARSLARILLHSARLLTWSVWVVLFFAASRASAHPAPNSAILIDIGQASVGVELVIPLSELESALRPRFGDKAKRTVEQDSQAVAEYLLEHVGARSDTGQAWSTQLRSVSTGILGDHPALVAKLQMKPPAGASSRHFDFQFDAVTHEVMSHVAIVMLRSDFYTGKLTDAPEFINGLQHPVKSLRINQVQAQSWLLGLNASFRLGLRHIAAGADHLLFLLTLVLVAPVVARGKQWVVDSGWRGPAMRLLWTTMAFSLGHSLSLVLGVAFAWQFASGPVELLVAVSILVSAIHAWRPIFPRLEVRVAGCFGLVHGAAFATALGSYAFDSLARTVALVGFTAGIEAFQLLMACIALPALLWLRESATFRWIRPSLIVLTALAALGWIIQRAPDGVSPALAALSDQIGRNPALGAVVIASAGAAAYGLRAVRHAHAQSRPPHVGPQLSATGAAPKADDSDPH